MRNQLFLLFLSIAMGAQAQIGYQVSLLNSATGEPRANETVSVSVAITNSEDTQIFSSTQSATTNDFGVLSLQIGNSTTFDNVDWSKLPFFISASVDGIMVGKSQILNVPVAEAAKQLIGVPLDSICKTWYGSSWQYDYTYVLTLNRNMQGTFTWSWDSGSSTSIIDKFIIMGDIVYLIIKYDQWLGGVHPCYYENGTLMVSISDRDNEVERTVMY